MPDHPTPAQIRGARGMLGWTILDLARASRLSVVVVRRIEDSAPLPDADRITGLIRDALVTQGITFLSENRGAGVLLRER